MRSWWHRALAARRRWRCRRGLHKFAVSTTTETELAWIWVCIAPGCGHAQMILPSYRREVRVPWR